MYGGSLCQDTKVGFTKSYFPPFQLLCYGTSSFVRVIVGASILLLVYSREREK